MSLRPSERRAHGEAIEARVAAHLERHGFTILDRNFSTRRGEVDLIAEKGEVLAFVEVRSRRPSGFGSPAETVGYAKRRRIVAAASEWAAGRGLLERRAIRFDVIAVIERPEGELELEWLQGAFDATGAAT